MPESTALTLVGRSGSHFTRVTRMFARELRVSHAFRPIGDILSLDAATYAGNPALKLPILETPSGALFGSLNICRELSRHSQAQLRVVWPEDHRDAVCCNALELTLQGMATETSLIIQKLAGDPPDTGLGIKLRASLEQSVAWLDAHVFAAVDALDALDKARDLSLLELYLFCFVSHLPWREVLSLEGYDKLQRFSREYGSRPSALDTPYQTTPSPPPA